MLAGGNREVKEGKGYQGNRQKTRIQAVVDSDQQNYQCFYIAQQKWYDISC